MYVSIRDSEEFGFMVRVRAGRSRVHPLSEYLEVATGSPFGRAMIGHFKRTLQFNLRLRIYHHAGVFSKLPPTSIEKSVLQFAHHGVEFEKVNESKGSPNQVNSHSRRRAMGVSGLG